MMRLCSVFSLLFAAAVSAQPGPAYLPRGVHNYIVNYGAVRRDPFLIDFAARQFVMSDEQTSPEGRQMRAINPNLPVLHYHCLVSSYRSFKYFDSILNPDERCFMHSCDPAGLQVSRVGARTVISWLNDRRYPTLQGYRLYWSNDTNASGVPFIDTIVKTRCIVLDSLPRDGAFLRVATVRSNGREAWYSSSWRVHSPALPSRHHVLDSLATASYGTSRDSIRLRIRLDSTVTIDSVVAQVDLDHDRNPAEIGERFRLGITAGYCTLALDWDRSGWNAGTGFRVLVYSQAGRDTLPSGGFLFTTNTNNRVRSHPYGNELMNPADSTWQQYSLDRIAEHLSLPDYAGVFTDNTTHRVQTWMYETPRIYSYDTLIWQNGMIHFLARIDTLARPWPVFFNGLGMSGSEVLLPWCDGGMYEGWVYAKWDTTLNHTRWIAAQNQVLRTRNTHHRIFLALPQAPMDDSIRRLYVRASYLLTADDSVWYADANSFQVFAHQPEMNLCLGHALNSARDSIAELRHANGYYQRSFANGVVIVNPDIGAKPLASGLPAHRLVATSGTTIDGSRVFTVPFSDNYIPGRSALILLNNAIASPVISSVDFVPPRPRDSTDNLVMARVYGRRPLHVEAALDRIAGPLHLVLHDDGLDGDTLAGDSVYTGRFALPPGVLAWTDTVRILAYDTFGLVTVYRRTVRPAPNDSLNWIANWSFESDVNRDGAPDYWSRYARGYVYDTTGQNAVSGTRSIHCNGSPPDSFYGVVQYVYLNQTRPETLVISGWSRAESVSGVRNNDYSIYCDCRYNDSTSLYGQCAVFDVGSHDWQYAQKYIIPAKPITRIAVYCLFRRHGGRVWYDHIALRKALPPEPPHLLIPARDSSLSTTQPQFDWTDVMFGVKYRLQVGDSSFGATVLDTTVAASDLHCPWPLAPDTWYWRVMAGDELNRWSSWSVVSRFTIDTCAPLAPKLIAPESAATGIALRPLFSWQAVSSVPLRRWPAVTAPPTMRYRLVVARDSGFADLVADTVLTETAVTLRCTLEYYSTYHWHVQATDAAGNTGPWSSRFRFTTLGEGWVRLSDLPAGPRGRNVKDGGSLVYHEQVTRRPGEQVTKRSGDQAIERQDDLSMNLSTTVPLSDASNCIYAFKGNNRPEFYRYDIKTNTWTTRESLAMVGSSGKKRGVKKGASLTSADGRIYATKGGGTAEFWCYDPALSGTPTYPWIQLRDVAGVIKEGSGMVALDGSVYLLRGSKSTDFLRYDIATDTWASLAPAPSGVSGKPFKNGSSICLDPVSRVIYALKGSCGEFYAYDISADSWTTRATLPMTGSAGRKKVGPGSGTAYANGCVYALKGGNTYEYWSYQCDSDKWVEKENVPRGTKKVKDGGALVTDGRCLYALKGNNTLEYYRYTPTISSLLTTGSPNVEGSPLAVADCCLSITPNPFTNTTLISYRLPQTGNVNLKLYDVTGKLVTTLASGYYRAGSFSFSVSRSTLSTGIYLLKLETKTTTATAKLIVE